MDHHVPAAVTAGLRERGIDCLTSEEDGTKRLPDDELLARATDLGRVMFSQDVDMLAIASEWQHTGREFAGLFYARQMGITVGQAIRALELAAFVLDPSEMMNRVEYLPL